jgi:hypothetical protein
MKKYLQKIHLEVNNCRGNDLPPLEINQIDLLQLITYSPIYLPTHKTGFGYDHNGVIFYHFREASEGEFISTVELDWDLTKTLSEQCIETIWGLADYFGWESQYKEKGLVGKYKISKTDKTPLNPNAIYFVLRYDYDQKDKYHADACRAALRTYINSIRPHMPNLANDLVQSLQNTEK